MLSILAEKIHDNRFLRLLRNMLKAGYLEDWKWNATLSGVPQGGVVSPILSNIYLDRLDNFARDSSHTGIHPGGKEGQTPPTGESTTRSAVPASAATVPRCGSCASSSAACPAGITHDPGYRRLRYIRYADDHLLGFAGPKAEAEQIKARLAAVPA